jgi:hypothetical protein
MSIAMFPNKSLMRPFPGLAHTHSSGSVEEHERLSNLSIGNILLVKGVEDQIQHPGTS